VAAEYAVGPVCTSDHVIERDKAISAAGYAGFGAGGPT